MFVEEHPKETFPANRRRDEFVEEILEICDKYLPFDGLDEVSDLLDCPHYQENKKNRG